MLTLNICALLHKLLNSSSYTLEQAVGAPGDAAKRFGRSALHDAAAAERAGLRAEKIVGVACPPWWLPPFMANDGQALSSNQVAHVDVGDGKPHCDLMSNQFADQPKPADSPSHAPPASESSNPVRSLSSVAKGRETINRWTSSTLLCALVFVLSVYAFNGKVPTPFLLHAAYTPLCPAAAPCSPCSPYSLRLAPRLHPHLQEFRTMYAQDSARKKGTKMLNHRARSPKVHRTCQFIMRQSFS